MICLARNCQSNWQGNCKTLFCSTSALRKRAGAIRSAGVFPASVKRSPMGTNANSAELGTGCQGLTLAP